MKLRLIGLLGLLALVLASCGGTTPQASGPTEGIQVHGDWTIDVVNADGSVAEHRVFQNALLPSGPNAIASLFTQEVQANLWNIVLSGGDSTAGYYDGEPCQDTDGEGHYCRMNEQHDPFNPFGDWDSANVTATKSPENEIVLEGSHTVNGDGQIVDVSTYIGTCSNSAAGPCPTSGSGGSTFGFTRTTLINEGGAVAPIDVSPGQSVQVQVVISFTTG